MTLFRSTLVLVVAALAECAPKAAEPEPPKENAFVVYVMSLIDPVKDATLGAASDVLDLLLAIPQFAVSIYVWVVGLARSVPDLIKNVYMGDASQLTDLTDFCVYAAAVIFVVYSSLTALNLALSMACTVKDYFKEYLVLPTTLPLIGKIPEPIVTVRNFVQKEVLDRISDWKVGSWIVPLEGQSGTPSLRGAVPVLASAVSACMILACTPSVYSLMKGGADKEAAEALAYTLGTALGLQYLVKITS